MANAGGESDGDSVRQYSVRDRSRLDSWRDRDVRQGRSGWDSWRDRDVRQGRSGWDSSWRDRDVRLGRSGWDSSWRDRDARWEVNPRHQRRGPRVSRTRNRPQHTIGGSERHSPHRSSIHSTFSPRLSNNNMVTNKDSIYKGIPTKSRTCHEKNSDINTNWHSLPSYSLSLKLLDKLEPSSVFDSHCHMDFILFQRLPHMELESYDQFLHQYPLMNHRSLEGFITNFCSPRLWTEHLSSSSPLVHSLLARTSVYYTLGCHPHYARDLMIPRNYRLLVQLLEKAGRRCVAVGECGLDTSGKNKIAMADQLEAFKMQIKLAIRLKKPLVLHIRGAEKEAIKAMKEVKLPLDWPIHRYFIYTKLYLRFEISSFNNRHCWNDTWAVCEEWMAMFTNSVVGITPLVTFSDTPDLQTVSRNLPLDRIVLETDAPYFLPRGGGREGFLGHTTKEFSLPMHVVNVAAQVAAIKECKLEVVLRASRINISRVYNV